MTVIKGDYGCAHVFTNDVEATIREQITTLMNHPIAEKAHVRVMPDCHAGAGCVIGYTAKVTDKVVPNLIGVDIGCGVSAWELKDYHEFNFPELDHFIRGNIPSGHQVRGSIHPELDPIGKAVLGSEYSSFKKSVNLSVKQIGQDGDRVWRSLGSLGGGNHFIEIDVDEDGIARLIVHSGSRNFGLKIANWHQAEAVKKTGKMKGLEYLTGKEKDRYLKDMKTAQEYAALNRRLIGNDILTALYNLPYNELPFIESIHNYISFEDSIVRKGAIAAHRGQTVIIPLNMADGTILGQGKGNPEWNNSAPHGAGRKLSRRQAMKQVPLQDFKHVMEKHNVWTSCVGPKTLDESPQAYKNAARIIEDLEPAVEITSILRPVYNYKATS